MLNEIVRVNSQRFIPQPMKELLFCWAVQLSGLLLVSVTSILWLSLLSWSGSDPSISIISNVVPANLLGSLGATIADLLLQSFGLSSVVILSCFTLWGINFSMVDQIDRFGIRMVLAISSVLTISCSLSALQVSSNWAFLHGYGGLVGDLTYNLVGGSFTILLGQAGGAVAGFAMIPFGCVSLIFAVGVDLHKVFKNVMLATNEDTVGLKHHLDAGSKSALQDPYNNFNSPDSKLFEDNLSDLRRVDPIATPRLHSSAAKDNGIINKQLCKDENSNDPQSYGECDTLDVRRIAQRFSPNNAMSQHSRDVRPVNYPDGIAQSVVISCEGNLSDKLSIDEEIKPLEYLGSDNYNLPSLNYLQTLPITLRNNVVASHKSELSQSAVLLTQVLKDFRVKGKISDIQQGPVVTLFEFEPAPGTKSSRIISLADDIARSMSAKSARIAAIQGRNAISIELSNKVREQVLLRDIFESQDYRNCKARLPLALGKGIDGKPIVADLTSMPHLLVVGTTGSGKSVGINAMILSLLYSKSPSNCRLLIINPKMLELSFYNEIPHLLSPVITDPNKTVLALQWAIRQMEDRYKKMTEMGVRSIEAFNNRIRQSRQTGMPIRKKVQIGLDPKTGDAKFLENELNFEPLPYIVIVVDEFADLMAVAGKEVDTLIKCLAQMARAAGLHLIMATQRPSVDVVTEAIKANFPTRLAYKVSSKIDSRTILDCSGAEQLLGQGDLLLTNGNRAMIRAHGPHVSDNEDETVTHTLRMQGRSNYAQDLIELIDTSNSACIYGHC